MTVWTEQDVEDFELWHETVIVRHDYSPGVQEELRQARVKWLSTVKRK